MAIPGSGTIGIPKRAIRLTDYLGRPLHFNAHLSLAIDLAIPTMPRRRATQRAFPAIASNDSRNISSINRMVEDNLDAFQVNRVRRCHHCSLDFPSSLELERHLFSPAHKKWRYRRRCDRFKEVSSDPIDHWPDEMDDSIAVDQNESSNFMLSCFPRKSDSKIRRYSSSDPRDIHGPVDPNPTNPDPFCALCNRKFLSQKDLERHFFSDTHKRQSRRIKQIDEYLDFCQPELKESVDKDAKIARHRALVNLDLIPMEYSEQIFWVDTIGDLARWA